MLADKKGQTGTGILSAVYIFMIVLIGTGLFLGMRAYYGNGYDFRGEEAEALLSQVVECFNNEGFFADETAFYEKCNIKKEVLEDDHLVYIRRKSDGVEFFIGVYDFKNRCELAGSDKKTNFPICKKSYVGDFEIIAASNQNSRVVGAGA